MTQWMNPLSLIVATLILSGCATTPVCTLAEPGPKNVILMIGDGMGFAQVEAGSLYSHGKVKGQSYWDYQPLAMSTHSTNTPEAYNPKKAWKDFGYHLIKPTDSAAAATTLATGVKTSNGRIGQDADENNLRSLVEDAETMNKSTGVLSTVYLSHATPASFGAHNKSRSNYEAIAQEMLLKSGLDLIIGAGHPGYDDDHKEIEEDPEYKYVGGEQLWNKLNAGEAGNDANGDGQADRWTLIQTLDDFEKLAEEKTTDRILGVLQVASTLHEERGGDWYAAPYAVPRNHDLPTMALLMQGALNQLSQNPNGYFLMAEGGAIDWAAHTNLSGRTIEEQRDFDTAIAAAVAWVEANSNWDDTLLIITADHETGYLCGPDSKPTWEPLKNNGKGVQPGMEWHSGGHSNQLVPLFAKGNGAEMLLNHIKGQDPKYGPYVDNTDIPKVIKKVWR